MRAVSVKLFPVLALAVFLSGCAGTLQERFDNLWLAKWDAIEAQYVAEVKFRAQDLYYICDEKQFTQEKRVSSIFELNSASGKFLAYSQTLPDDNRPVIRVAKNITDSSREFYDRARNTEKKMSRLYCETKATNLINMAHQAQIIVQRKRK